MNAFEDIVKQRLKAEGYWVRHSVKLEISPSDKKTVGLTTVPRPEMADLSIGLGFRKSLGSF
jgi:hypothetical protein